MESHFHRTFQKSLSLPTSSTFQTLRKLSRLSNLSRCSRFLRRSSFLRVLNFASCLKRLEIFTIMQIQCEFITSILFEPDQLGGGTWLVVNARLRKKYCKQPPYVGSSGNNRVVTRSSSPISRLFLPRFFVCYQLQQRAEILSRIPVRAFSTRINSPREQLTRSILVIFLFVLLFVLFLGRLQLFMDSTFLTFLELLLELERRLWATRMVNSIAPSWYLLSLRFMGAGGYFETSLEVSF